MFYLARRTDAKIIGSYLTTAGYPTNGFRVVSIPPYVAIDEQERQDPATLVLDDITSQKYQGVLSRYPVFDFVRYDDMDDMSGWDLAHPQTHGGSGPGSLFLGPRAVKGGLSIGVFEYRDGFAQTLPVDIGEDGDFDTFLAQWDAYGVAREGDFVYHVPVDPDTLEVHFSNDGGATFERVYHEHIFALPSAGHEVVLRFVNKTAQRVYLGGMCFLY